MVWQLHKRKRPTRGSQDGGKPQSRRPAGDVPNIGANVAVKYGTRYYLGVVVEYRKDLTTRARDQSTMKTAVLIRFYVAKVNSEFQQGDESDVPIELCHGSNVEGHMWFSVRHTKSEISTVPALPATITREDYDPDLFVALTAAALADLFGSSEDSEEEEEDSESSSDRGED